MIKKLLFAYQNNKIKKQDPVMQHILDNNLSYLKAIDFQALDKTIHRLNDQKVSGIFMEAGCALGGSAIYIADKKGPLRTFKIYDVFDMIPPPSADDEDDVHKRYEIIKSGKSTGINNDTYYGYEKDLLQRVKNNFTEAGIDLDEKIEFIKGKFQETMEISEPVAFAHIDCDWYESVMVCLNKIVPHLSIGGEIILDDYFVWSGCQKATDQFLADSDLSFEKYGERKLHLVRKS